VSVALRRDGLALAGLGLAARLAVVAWAAPRFPPAGDGTYYQRIAERIAAGLGYTWLWPDGAVTYAAHYPVGYPAAIGAVYALVGARPAAAMALHAVLGALAVLAVHALAARTGSRRTAALAGLFVAVHPGLVAYTPALMTEGVTASLLACAAWAAARLREVEGRRAIGVAMAIAGLVLGIATLVRPQSIVLAPLFGLAAAWRPGTRAPTRRLAGFAAGVTAVALATCAPWSARNCVRMQRCALVSVNGGWNLLIGADPASTGAWSPVRVPDACREVFDEAEKDECFGAEARRWIAEHPREWLALAPRKLAATFDYAGAAGWYLHESNPAAFGDDAKIALGAVETVYERSLLLLALFWAARVDSAARDPTRRIRPSARLAIVAAGLLFAVTQHAWLAYAALLAATLTRPHPLARAPVLALAALATIAATMLVHAAFFGAGRYGMVVFPFIAGLAALGVTGSTALPWSPFGRRR
jgi:hypothetical protein